MKHPLSSIKTLAAAQNILSSKPNQTDTFVEVLGLIGLSLDASRVGLYKLNPDGTLFEPVAQWANEDVPQQDNGSLAVDALEDLDAEIGETLAEPMYEGPTFTGMLVIDIGNGQQEFEQEARELARNSAVMLAPHLNAEISKPSPPKLSRPKEEPAAEAPDDLQILIVEDNEANLFMIKKFIERVGAVPHTARNGQDAIQICKEVKFDAILMDLTMPKLDGFDATREIVTSENLNRKTPIIAVTADITEGIERRCQKVGIQHYISKPIRRDTIIKAITELTNKQPKFN